MKSYIKSNIFNVICSDGSLRPLYGFGHFSKHPLDSKFVDNLNHPIWTGQRTEKQTEVSVFIERLKGKTSAKIESKKIS